MDDLGDEAHLQHHEQLEASIDDMWTYADTCVSCVTCLTVVFMIVVFTFMWATDPVAKIDIDEVS